MYDLIEEWKEPKSGVGYANVWIKDDKPFMGTIIYDTRKEADGQANSPAQCLDRIACVRVEWKEGQFDD